MIYVFEDGYTSNGCRLLECCVVIPPHAQKWFDSINGKCESQANRIALFTTTSYIQSVLSITCSAHIIRREFRSNDG